MNEEKRRKMHIFVKQIMSDLNEEERCNIVTVAVENCLYFCTEYYPHEQHAPNCPLEGVINPWELPEYRDYEEDEG